MFIQILKKVGPDLTPQRFQQVAGTITYSIPGVVGPTYYPQGYQVGPPCSEELVYSNGTTWSVAVPDRVLRERLQKGLRQVGAGALPIRHRLLDHRPSPTGRWSQWN